MVVFNDKKKDSINSDLSKWKSLVILMNLLETNQFVTRTIENKSVV